MSTQTQSCTARSRRSAIVSRAPKRPNFRIDSSMLMDPHRYFKWLTPDKNKVNRENLELYIQSSPLSTAPTRPDQTFFFFPSGPTMISSEPYSRYSSTSYQKFYRTIYSNELFRCNCNISIQSHKIGTPWFENSCHSVMLPGFENFECRFFFSLNFWAWR